MPATQTITAWNVFSAGTKARAAQVNTNLDAFRGYLIPIDPTITTGQAVSDLSYGLGAASHRWGESWIEKINFGQTTAGWQISDETTTAGDLVLKKNGATVARFTDSGLGPNIFYSPGTSASISYDPSDYNTSTGVKVDAYTVSITCDNNAYLRVGFANYNDASGHTLGSTTKDSHIKNTGADQWWVYATVDSVASYMFHIPVSMPEKQVDQFTFSLNSIASGAHTVDFYFRSDSAVTATTFTFRAVKAFVEVW